MIEFRQKLDRLKTKQDFEWYRYDSLANWTYIEKLVPELPKDKPILDIGAADGDLAFFLESMGYQVTAIDYPPTNHNHMAGIRYLKQALNSSVEILQMDIDTQFTLPKQDYGVALILGALYHLKNPMYLLETVSKQAKQMIVSTRIARRFPNVASDLRQVSAAYLLTDTELNQDNSNFWIFTEAAFRQMLKRTNWQIEALQTFGDTEASNPIDAGHDERVFCFARSRYALANVELLDGWHEAEGEGWRWTKRTFAIRAEGTVKMKLYLLHPVTLKSTAGPSVTYTEPGYHEAVYVTKGETRFELDRATPPDERDNRERGIIVHSLEID